MSSNYDIFKKLDERNILLSFKGVMTSELLTSVLSIMESKLEFYEEKLKVKKKIVNILVECLQNLHHHVDINDTTSLQDNSVLVMISKGGSDYVIMTGNYMSTHSAEEIEEVLKLINTMGKVELKTYYNKILSNNSRSEKGTAGLGMVDIARKSEHKLDYDFKAVDKELSFFSLSVKVTE